MAQNQSGLLLQIVCPHARPVKQKVKKQALERQQFIAEEIKKLEADLLMLEHSDTSSTGAVHSEGARFPDSLPEVLQSLFFLCCFKELIPVGVIPKGRLRCR